MLAIGIVDLFRMSDELKDILKVIGIMAADYLLLEEALFLMSMVIIIRFICNSSFNRV